MIHHETWDYITDEHLLSDEFEPVWRDAMWKITAVGFGIIGVGTAIVVVGAAYGPAGAPLDAIGAGVISAGMKVAAVGQAMRVIYITDAWLDRIDPKATEPPQHIQVPVAGKDDFPNGEISQTLSVRVVSGRGQRDTCIQTVDGVFCPYLTVPN